MKRRSIILKNLQLPSVNLMEHSINLLADQTTIEQSKMISRQSLLLLRLQRVYLTKWNTQSHPLLVKISVSFLKGSHLAISVLGLHFQVL